MTLVSEEDALNEILKGIELAQERIAAGTLGCFHCMKNKATNVILLVTDKIENGAKGRNRKFLLFSIVYFPLLYFFVKQKNKGGG